MKALLWAIGFGVTGLLAMASFRKPSPLPVDPPDPDPEPLPLPPLPEASPGRQAVLRAAYGELGNADPTRYWQAVAPGLDPAHPNLRRMWCGGFALWAVNQGAVNPLQWEVGKGFCYKLPQTRNPLPGDIAYFDRPFQHQSIVVSVTDGILTSIDGNQGRKGVAVRTRPIGSVTAFYSIDPLLSSVVA